MQMWNFVMNRQAEQNSAELSLAKRHWRAEYERGNTPKAMRTHDSGIDAPRKDGASLQILCEAQAGDNMYLAKQKEPGQSMPGSLRLNDDAAWPPGMLTLLHATREDLHFERSCKPTKAVIQYRLLYSEASYVLLLVTLVLKSFLVFLQSEKRHYSPC